MLNILPIVELEKSEAANRHRGLSSVISPLDKLRL